MDSIIKFENVNFRYEDSKDLAVNNVSLEIKRGDFVAVLGHNGSGKSTLAKLTNSILLPQDGQILVNGMDTADESRIYDIRQTVGMVFQNPDNQIVATVVEEDVAFGPENLGVDPREIRERVDAALKAVEMYEYRQHEPHKLSGGQKQRVAIAGVIAMQPECIVLDEATAMLDPRGRKDILKTIRMLNEQLGITVVFITHFMDEAVCANRVIVMDNAEIIMDGTPQEVFSKTGDLRVAGLDVPQVTELSQWIEKEGFGISKNILSTDECVDMILSILEVQKG
ncbi:MAG: energy-coupling factor transporter ATPase [Oscillospiraceae bacterium]|nr:energy-coupling factor transporter ATPase [Oscillospiraceae bacterium]